MLSLCGYPGCLRLAREAIREERARRQRQGILCDTGATLVEMALTLAIVLTVIFGLIEMSLALYTFHYISDAAREGTRWAVVRGSTSCTNTPNLTNCNATAGEIQDYVQNLGYPVINPKKNMKVTTTWLSADTSSSTTAWTSCGTVQCNAPGNAVQITVNYAFPLNIPFWKSTQWNLSSTSQMVISQ